MIILKTTDFEGKFAVAKANSTRDVLPEYIEQYEKATLIFLMGLDLATLFIADLNNGQPTAQRFQDLYNPFFKKDGQQVRESKGIKQLLKSVVYYEYITQTTIVASTQAGVAGQQVDTANMAIADNTFRFAEQKYNEAMETWKNIVWFMRKEQGTYPEFIEGDFPGPRWAPIL